MDYPSSNAPHLSALKINPPSVSQRWELEDPCCQAMDGKSKVGTTDVQGIERTKLGPLGLSQLSSLISHYLPPTCMEL